MSESTDQQSITTIDTSESSAIDKGPSDEEIQRDLVKIAQKQGTRKLHAIIDHPHPQKLVKAMVPQELLYTVKDIGLSDSAEVLELATQEQVSYCLDIDCWKKDSTDLESIDQWLQLLVAGEIQAAEKILASLDPDLLVRYFRDFFIIHRVEKDEDPPFIPEQHESMGSPDGNYIIEFPFVAGEPRLDIAKAALQLFFQYDPTFSYHLFEAILCSLPSDLEERAYQFRRARTEELGFVDYYQAIGIYQPLPPKAKSYPPSPVKDIASRLPVIKIPSGRGLFHKALKQIADESIKERIQTELILFNNKVLSADQVDPSQRVVAERSLKGVVRTLDIGLEVLAGNEVAAATHALISYHIEWVFRKGFTELARLRNKANLIARAPRFRFDEKHPLSLLDSPYDTFISPLRTLKPRRSSIMDTPSRPNTRHFRNLQEIQEAKEILDMIGLLPRLFFEEFGFSHEELHELADGGTLIAPTRKEDIRFSHLFLTALAQFTLNNTFALEPLTVKEIQEFLSTIFQPNPEPPHALDPAFQEQVEQLLLQRPGTLASEKPHLQTFLQNIWTHLCEEAAYLDLNEDIDPRFLNLFLVTK